MFNCFFLRAMNVYKLPMKNLLLVLLSSIVISLQAQYDDILYRNHTYFDFIQSVQFSHSGLVLSLPIINLGSSGQLTLEFDDREGGYKNYTYQILHCDKDWNPSNLTELEFMEGFNGEEINEFAYSTNAYSDYTHYTLVLPNEDLRWTISGNFLLIIYDQDMEHTVLTRQFIVTESAAEVSGLVIKPQNLQKMNTHQELKVNVNYDDIRIMRPQQELFLTVMQNGNTNSAYSNVKGTFTRNNTLFFDDFDALTFPALKEFRSCDVRTLKYRSEFVHSINQEDGVTYVLMDLGRKRANKHYYTEPDANGGYIIENKDFADGEVSSEYVQAIFTLETEGELEEDVYIVGAFTDWQVREQFRMEYDHSRGLYEKTLHLKQGFYDYMFATEDQNGMLNLDIIEGSWFETENDYQLIIYYREMGGEYDRVLDVSVINSNPSN